MKFLGQNSFLKQFFFGILFPAVLFSPSLSQAAETTPEFKNSVAGIFVKSPKPFLGMMGLARVNVFAAPALLIAQVSYLIMDGLTDELGPADAIVILGSRINSDGKPSYRLKARLNRGYDLYQQGFSRKIVVTGGVGREGYSEAQVMADYLKALGVPSSALLLDKNAKNTYQNALFTQRIAKVHGFHSVILVSQYFHITRAKLAFRKVGFQNIYSAHASMPPELRDLYAVLREWLILDNYLMGKK
jgi:uncharacterized SAM-binding protein YcdF (DUF218 family)